MEDKPVDQDSPFHRFNRLDGDQREQLLMLAKVLDESPRLNEWVTEAIRGNPQQRRLSSLGLLDRDGAALGHRAWTL